jgi:biotin carboxyl carrier protein
VRYEVEISGRVRQVDVQRAGGRFTASVDGRVRQVDIARIDAQTLSLIVDGGAATCEIGVANDAATGLLQVRVGTTVVDVAVNGVNSVNGGRRRRRDRSADRGSGPQRIVAPMPGKIVRVGVKTGDAVRARQTVVVVEAMKMENELKADRDGVAGDVRAVEGASVEAGALLVVIQ